MLSDLNKNLNYRASIDQFRDNTKDKLFWKTIVFLYLVEGKHV